MRDLDLLVRRVETFDSADPLHHAHRIPRQVVVHHRARILEIQPFARHVRRDEDVRLEQRIGVTAAAQRRESVQRFVARDHRGSRVRDVSDDGDHPAPAAQPPQEIEGGVTVFREDDDA